MGRSQRHATRSLGVLGSPRFRRRIAAVMVVLAGTGGIAAALIVGNTAKPASPVTARPPIVEHAAEPLRLTAADRTSILAVGRQFVLTAVERKHPERAWPLASSALRQGTTLADWKVGTLPFSPSRCDPPAGRLPTRSWARSGSTSSSSRPISRPAAAPPPHARSQYQVVRVRPGSSTAGPRSAPRRAVVDEPFSGGAAAVTARSTPPPSEYWILVPFAVLASALLLPLVLVARSRRAEHRLRRRLRDREAFERLR